MTIRKKGSRKIIVCDKEYRWNVTGNDGWITVVIWPTNKDDVKLIGTFDYHDEYEKNSDDGRTYKKIKGQILITNRVIRKIIDSVGVEEIEKLKGQINLGSLEKIYDINDAIREEVGLKY